VDYVGECFLKKNYFFLPCVDCSFIGLEYFNYLYGSIIPCMFASNLFLQNGYEVALLRFNNPFCVEVFLLPKENNKIFLLLPYFISFKI